jgi:hypothetical protein
MPGRRRIKHIDTLEERLAREAKHLREQAAKLRPCLERERLLRKARQVETGAQMSTFLSSGGLHSPR